MSTLQTLRDQKVRFLHRKWVQATAVYQDTPSAANAARLRVAYNNWKAAKVEAGQA